MTDFVRSRTEQLRPLSAVWRVATGNPCRGHCARQSPARHGPPRTEPVATFHGLTPLILPRAAADKVLVVPDRIIAD